MEDRDDLGEIEWGPSERPQTMMRYSPIEEFFDQRRNRLLQKHCLAEDEGTGTIYHYWNEDVYLAVNNNRKYRNKHYKVHWNNWFSFSFTLQSNLIIKGDDESDAFVHTDMTWRIMREIPGTTRFHSLMANGNLKWAALCCSESYIERVLGRKIDEYTDKNGNLIFPETFIYNISKFNPIMLQALEEIFKVDMPMRLYANFLHAKAEHLVSLALSALLRQLEVNDPATIGGPDMDDPVARATTILDNSLSDPPTIEMIGEFVGLDKTSLIRAFQKVHGKTPSEYIKEIQLEEAKRLLEKTKMPLGEIATRVGYRYQCNLSSAFRSKYGLTPLGYRKQFRAGKKGV